MAISAAMIKELRETTGAGILDSKKALESSDGDMSKAIELLREKGLAQAAKKASREANEGLVVAKVSDDGKRAAMIAVNCETDFVARTDDFGAFVDSLLQQYYQADDLNSVEDLLNANYISDSSKQVSGAIQDAISKLGENIVVNNADRMVLEGEGIVDAYIHSNNRVGVLVQVEADGPVSDQAAFSELAHDIALQIAAVNPTYVSREQVPAERVDEERKILLAQLAADNKPDEIKARIVDGRMNKFYSEICLLEQEFIKDSSLTIDKLLKQSSKSLGTNIAVGRFTRFELGAS